MLLKPIYDQPDYSGYYSPSVGGRRFFVRKNGKFGLFELNSTYTSIKEIIPAKYDTLYRVSPVDASNPSQKNAYYIANINKKWGILDTFGKEIGPFTEKPINGKIIK